jgi:hypothetical protein
MLKEFSEVERELRRMLKILNIETKTARTEEISSGGSTL